jgi:hypothetical protein
MPKMILRFPLWERRPRRDAPQPEKSRYVACGARFSGAGSACVHRTPYARARPRAEKSQRAPKLPHGHPALALRDILLLTGQSHFHLARRGHLPALPVAAGPRAQWIHSHC